MDQTVDVFVAKTGGTQVVLRKGSAIVNAKPPRVSKKTAKTYIKLSRKANINNKLKEVHSLCLSKNIANVFPRNYWKKMYTSAHPNLLSLIDTIRKIN